MNQFIRSELLLGKENIDKLKNFRVAIFGLGGVGSYVLEGLTRIGIGNFVLVDADVIELSNLNRQIIATHKTIGMNKVEAALNRVLSINPMANVSTHKIFYLGNNDSNIIDNCDYVIDAIDTVSAKISLAETCFQKNIPLISSMGTGNKLDPTKLQVSDVFQTSVCPLARVMRRELKKRNIPSLKVVYSTEEPITPINPYGTLNSSETRTKQTPGSVSFVPSVAGLIIAGEVVRDLLKLS